MRHSNYEGASALLNSGVDAELEAGHEGFTAFQPKSLHGVELARHECTPLMGPIQTLVHVAILIFRRLSVLE